MVVDGPISPADAPELSARACELLEKEDAELLLCDVGALTEPDVGTIDVLARLQLTALRLGGRLCLRRASPQLKELLVITGLVDVVPARPDDRRTG